jgi:hypothetical protein
MINTSAARVATGRISLFVVVEPRAKMPSSAARDELSRIRRTCPLSLTALVHEGTGFSAAMVRGVTTSLNLLEAPAMKTHVFANVRSAARWLETKAPEHGTALDIEAAVRALRNLAPPA